MAISLYVKALRKAVGSQLLMVPAVAAIIRDESGGILLHRRSDDGGWSLPAGAVDLGESPARAITREVREETGLMVVPARILGVFGGSRFRHVYPNGDEVEYTVIVFGCHRTGGALEARDGEALELRYFAPESMPSVGLPFPAELFTDDRRKECLF